jgi:pimeloyl-ACP methyl ester carboxylesterase
MSQSTTGRQGTLHTSFGPLGYRDDGPTDAGPPLVFLQGFLAGPDVWSALVGELVGTFRCVTVDWPFGAHRQGMHDDADLSPPGIARLTVEVLDCLDIPHAVLVGNDSGGVIVQLVLASRPERVTAAVLAACDAFECFPPGAYRQLFRLASVPGMVRLMSRAMAWGPVARSRLGFGAVISHDPESTAAWSTPLADARIRRDARKLMTGGSNRQTLGAARRFGEFDRPVLVVWAGRDRLFPPALGQRLAAAFPRGRLAVIPDSATFIPHDQPGQLAKLIQEFLLS